MAAIIFCQASREKIFHPRNSKQGSQSWWISPKAEANNLRSQLVMKRMFACIVYFLSDCSVPQDLKQKVVESGSLHLIYWDQLSLRFLDRLSEAVYVVSTVCANMSACWTQCTERREQTVIPCCSWARGPETRGWQMFSQRVFQLLQSFASFLLTKQSLLRGLITFSYLYIEYEDAAG